jgi:hypothetical protein
VRAIGTAVQPSDGVEPSGAAVMQMHPAAEVIERHAAKRSPVAGAARGQAAQAVGSHALLARYTTPRSEVIGQLSAPTEVHLGRRLAFECAVGKRLVVLGHVESDEPLHGREIVERVQEQPLMLERTPPRLDERRATARAWREGQHRSLVGLVRRHAGAHRDALWTFVTHEGVEPTNNHAELELRDFVMWRKRSFGSQSERGERFAERMRCGLGPRP